MMVKWQKLGRLFEECEILLSISAKTYFCVAFSTLKSTSYRRPPSLCSWIDLFTTCAVQTKKSYTEQYWLFLNYNKQTNFTFLLAVPRSPSRISPASAPRTPLQTAKATGVIYSVPDNISTPPPSQPRSSFRASPPKGIRGYPVWKNGKSATQDVSKGEQSCVEPTVDTLRPQTSASRLR